MLDSLDNAHKNQTNWLMPIGVREYNLNIQDSSSLLLAESNFGVHHSNTENIVCVCVVMTLTFKVARYRGDNTIFLC